MGCKMDEIEEIAGFLDGFWMVFGVQKNFLKYADTVLIQDWLKRNASIDSWFKKKGVFHIPCITCIKPLNFSPPFGNGSDSIAFGFHSHIAKNVQLDQLWVSIVVNCSTGFHIIMVIAITTTIIIAM